MSTKPGQPQVQHADLIALWKSLRDSVPRIKQKSESLFNRSAFIELVTTGQSRAREHFAKVVAESRRAVPAAEDDEWRCLWSGLAQSHGVRVSDEELDHVIENRYVDYGQPFRAFLERIAAPSLDIGSLFLADINNDGQIEYVVCDRNSVGLHNDRIAAIYGPHSTVFYEVALPARLPFQKPQHVIYFADPFLSIDPEGTVIMSFREGIGSKEKRASYVWTGNRVRLVERVQVGTPFV